MSLVEQGLQPDGWVSDLGFIRVFGVLMAFYASSLWSKPDQPGLFGKHSAEFGGSWFTKTDERVDK